MGWWVGDAFNRLNQERRRNQPAAPAAGAGVAANAGGPGIPAQAAADAPVHAGAAVRANHRRSPASNNLLASVIPLVHLDVDAGQLRLPTSPTHREANHPVHPREAQRQPPRWLTQFCLPVLLWVVTLMPEWEAIRARAIRRRERTMRVLVGEMSAGAQIVEEGAEALRIYPEGLNPAAKAYYERVMARGEGIDWEEEREMQRALGVAEEELE